MDSQNMILVMLPKQELEALKAIQEEILHQLKELRTKRLSDISVDHLPAKKFMMTVNIGRTKFDQLRATNKIKTIKKKRKIYVPIGEVNRYFNDPTIQ